MENSPQGWRTVRLQDLAAHEPKSFLDGDWIESKDQDPSGSIRLLQVGNVLRGALKTSGTPRWVTPETAERLGCTLLRQGDILIARMPDPIGRACLVPELPYPAITAVDCAIMRIATEVCDPTFLVHWLNSDSALKRVATLVGGTTRQRVSRTNLGSVKLALPPIYEQREIAATLSRSEAAIAAGEAVVEQLHQLRRALAMHMFAGALPGARRSSSAPRGWRLARLEDLAHFITKGTTPTTLGFEWQESGVRFLRSECIGEGGALQLQGSQFISDEAHAALARSSIRGGDILVSITGYVGKVCRYPEVMPEANINQHIARVRIRSDVDVDPAFVHQVLATPAFRQYFESIVTGLAYPQIGLRQVRDAVIPLPSLGEQRRIAAALGAVDDAIMASKSELAMRSALYRAFADALLAGKVRIPAPVLA